MSDEEIRLECLRQANIKYKKDEDGMTINLNSEETLKVANDFYNFVKGNKNA